MIYKGEMILPLNATFMSEHEMRYLEGGGSSVIVGTAKSIRSRLERIIALATTGTGVSALAGYLVGGPVAAVANAIVGSGGWFNSYNSAASKAHHSVEKIINRYGVNKKCKMLSTYTKWYKCTGITVSVA